MRVFEFRDNTAAGSRGGGSREPAPIELTILETGTLRTKLKYIKMNQGEQDYEIPVSWFVVEHPWGNVVIDGGAAVEAAIDPRGYLGAAVDANQPAMTVADNCVDRALSVGVAPDDVQFVLQSHLHLDRTGAIGRFPKAKTIVQRSEYDYAHNPDWFSKAAYISRDIDRPDVDWMFLDGEYTDSYDLFGDGAVRMIFSPERRSVLLRLPNAGPVLLPIDAAYTVDHWEDTALPGIVCSSVDAVRSVVKLRAIAPSTGATVVTGHDPSKWAKFRHAPMGFYH